MKKTIALLAGLLILASALWICSNATDDFYKINLSQVGDYQDEQMDLEVSALFKEVFDDLTEQYDAFLCSAWNYEMVDGKRRYEYVTDSDIPIKYDYYGHSITVSENYFRFMHVKDIGGKDVTALLKGGKNTLNILVPEKYKNDEKQLTAIYQDYMYFNNVEVDNIYNEKLGAKPNTGKQTDFSVNIIYVPNGTSYAVYNPATKCKFIEDCIVIVINSENIHAAQLQAFLTQGFYVYSKAGNIENEIADVFQHHGLAEGFHSLDSVTELYREDWLRKILMAALCIAVIAIAAVLISRAKNYMHKH